MVANRAVSLLIVAFLAQSSVAQQLRHFTRDNVKEHFVELAKDSKPIQFPPIHLYESTPIKTIGSFLPCNSLGSPTLIVHQQVDGGTLAYVEYYKPRYNVIDSRGQQLVPETRERKGPFFFRGDYFASIADNGHFRPSGVFEVTGTYDYITVLGAKKTVLAIDEVTAESFPMPKHPSLLIEEHRRWTSKDDKLLASGAFAGYQKGTITVVDTDGVESLVRLSELSIDDQDWIREKIKSDKASKIPRKNTP